LQFSSEDIISDQDFVSSENSSDDPLIKNAKGHKRSQSVDSYRKPDDLFEETEKKKDGKKDGKKDRKKSQDKKNLKSQDSEGTDNTDSEAEKPQVQVNKKFISTKKKPKIREPVEVSDSTDVPDSHSPAGIQPIHILILVVFLALFIGISWRT